MLPRHTTSPGSTPPFYAAPPHPLARVNTTVVRCPPHPLVRVNNIARRKKYAALVESVTAAGGEALVFSSCHVSGEQLNQLTGVAAICRFPLPGLEDEELIEEL